MAKSRRTDPVTSRQAASEAESSGRAAPQRAICLAQVNSHPAPTTVQTNEREKVKQEEINTILDLHKKWLSNAAEGGKRANLMGANLRYARIIGAKGLLSSPEYPKEHFEIAGHSLDRRTNRKNCACLL